MSLSEASTSLSMQTMANLTIAPIVITHHYHAEGARNRYILTLKFSAQTARKFPSMLKQTSRINVPPLCSSNNQQDCHCCCRYSYVPLPPPLTEGSVNVTTAWSTGISILMNITCFAIWYRSSIFETTLSWVGINFALRVRKMTAWVFTRNLTWTARLTFLCLCLLLLNCCWRGCDRVMGGRRKRDY
jgi:hypothetical protein